MNHFYSHGVDVALCGHRGGPYSDRTTWRGKRKANMCRKCFNLRNDIPSRPGPLKLCWGAPVQLVPQVDGKRKLVAVATLAHGPKSCERIGAADLRRLAKWAWRAYKWTRGR